MATLSHSQSKRMYSWWWDSHISPKSSKWLEENLSDMDSKVKAMIKLIEIDADTFAKRAEMFYKKRPELLKLVEEFYRTYRALAEKYSSATGVLRQAHSTMVEVCPDHVPFELPDDPHTPSCHSVSSVVYTEENQFIDNVLGSEREVRKGPEFDEEDEKDQTSTESAVVVKFEKDIQVLKDTLAKLDAEKAAGLANFQQSLERLSKLESEVCRAQEDSKRVDGQAKKAESEVEILKKALYKLEAEKNANFLHYQHSLDRFSKLETFVSLAQAESKRVDEQACKANGEVQTLKEALYKLEAEKEFSFHGFQWSLERLSKIESELYHAQEDYKRVDERAKNAEGEVETLKEALKKLEAEKELSLLNSQQCQASIAHLDSDSSHSQSLKEALRNLESEKDDIEKKFQIAEEDGRKHIERALTAEEQVETLKHALRKLTKEKEATFFQYQQCLESISTLEDKLCIAQDDVQRLHGEVQRVVAKLYNVEERRLVLEELCESQKEKLSEKQKEMDVEKQRNEQKIVLLEERCRSMKNEMDEISNNQLQMPVLQGYIRDLLRVLREHGQKEEALENEKLDLEKELDEVQMIRHEREMQILKLSENNHSLSMENESLKCQSAVCAQAITALKDTISSLEKNTSVQTRFQKTRDKGPKMGVLAMTWRQPFTGKSLNSLGEGGEVGGGGRGRRRWQRGRIWRRRSGREGER